MKIGWVSNANLRNKGGAIYERFVNKLHALKLDLLVINGNHSGAGHDLYEYIDSSTQEIDTAVLFNLSNLDYKDEIPPEDVRARAINWANSKDNGTVYSGSVQPLKADKGKFVIGCDSFYDCQNECYLLGNEFGRMPTFRGLQSREEIRAAANSLALHFAQALADKVKECYKHKPKEILIFTNYPGSELSLDFGGGNVVPDNYKGLYLNRNIYPLLEPLVKAHPKVRHRLFASSPLCNNSAVIFPNLKEYVGVNYYTNEEGKTELAIHVIDI